MRRLQSLSRIAVLGGALVIIAMTLVLWSATGKAGFTKYHDPERAQREEAAAQDSFEDLFAEAGAEIESMPEVTNRFELGLLPGGPGKGLPSVLTIAGPAAVLALGASASLALRRKQPRGGTPQPAQS